MLPAMEDNENSSVDLSLTHFESNDLGEMCETSSTSFSIGSNSLESTGCVADKQRQRRQRRMQILRQKGLSLRQKTNVTTSCSSEPERIPTPAKVEIDRVPTDPKELRKWKNRQSAERSRQKITDTIEMLTYEILAQNCLLNDFEQQEIILQQLVNQHYYAMTMCSHQQHAPVVATQMYAFDMASYSYVPAITTSTATAPLSSSYSMLDEADTDLESPSLTSSGSCSPCPATHCETVLPPATSSLSSSSSTLSFAKKLERSLSQSLQQPQLHAMEWSDDWLSLIDENDPVFFVSS